MANESVRLDFDTAREADIPRVGHRKVVRLNGKPESLYVTDVSVEFIRVERYDDEGNFLGIRHDYVGTATLKPHLYIRTLSE